MESPEPPTMAVDTQIAEPFAYAWQDEDVTQPYRRKRTLFAARFMVPAVVIGAIAAADLVVVPPVESILRAGPSMSMPAPAPAAIPTVDPAVVTSEAQDSNYVRLLVESGFVFGAADRSSAVDIGHWTCSYLSYGHSREDTLGQLRDAGAGWTTYDASSALRAAVTAYCPQFG